MLMITFNKLSKNKIIENSWSCWHELLTTTATIFPSWNFRTYIYLDVTNRQLSENPSLIFRKLSEKPILGNARFLLYDPIWVGYGLWWDQWLCQKRKHSFFSWWFGHWIIAHLSWLSQSQCFPQKEEFLSRFDSWDRFCLILIQILYVHEFAYTFLYIN